MTAASQPQTTSRIDCLCGCGQNTGPKANYRPGHDATHVSNLLAELVRTQGASFSGQMVREMGKYLPTEALRIKFANAAHNFANRKAAKPSAPRQARTEWVDVDTDEYKLGRWTYPVQALMLKEGIAPKHPGEESEYKDLRRNTKRDGSGEWVALEGGELIGR